MEIGKALLKVPASVHEYLEQNRELVLDLWPTVGNLLHLSRATTYKFAKEGLIPTLPLGRQKKVSVVQLERMLNGYVKSNNQ